MAPEELKHRLHIFKLNDQTKIAKKYRHSPSIMEKQSFFKLEKESQ
jgi:hypothetical protein